MSKLEDIVDDFGHEVVNKYKTVDRDVLNRQARQQIKDWALDLIKEVDKPSFGRATDKFTKLKQLIKEQ